MGVSDVDDKRDSDKLYCKRCKNFGHWTDNCHTWGKDQCTHCSKYNHASDDCYFKDKPKLIKKEKKKENSRKRAKNEVNEANTAESDHSYAAIEEVGKTTSRGITFDSSKSGQYFNFDNKDVANYSINDESTLYYDWLADSATTSHITNRRDIFITYEPIQDTPITGIGDLQAQAEGRGDVNVYALYNGIRYPICLCSILYVPRNRHNLLSLGCWIAKGGDFLGRRLALISKQGNVIANGTLTSNNLIKFRFYFTKCPSVPCINTYPSTTQLEKDWNTWHRRFAHIGYSGLRKTFDKKLVTGFHVNRESPMPDCIACTEAKQSVIPFNKTGERKTNPGELTHIDVWGKYEVTSINGFQYYLLMVDDASRYVTVEFLKSKDQAAQKVKNYFTHLELQGKTPKAMWIDRGRKFVNEMLLEWCYSKGMQVHMTAPYSPSQNGIAEHMNRTLEELARAMRLAADLPTFLWE